MVVLEWLCYAGVEEVQYGECKTSKYTFWRTISDCLLHSAQRQIMMCKTCQKSHMQVIRATVA